MNALDDEAWHGLVVSLIKHFIIEEGTDYLGDKAAVTGVAGLSFEQEDRLRKLRDEARRQIGWAGYE